MNNTIWHVQVADLVEPLEELLRFPEQVREPDPVAGDDCRKDQVFGALGHAFELVRDGEEPFQLDVVLHPEVQNCFIFLFGVSQVVMVGYELSVR